MIWLLALVAYLLGSLSFAILLGRYRGYGDPRQAGSGNPGATNMLRLAGRRAALLTLLGDASKGALPVCVARYLDASLEAQAWIGLAAVVGHLYPLYFQFRGGKGVATAAGVLLALHWPSALCVFIAWIVVFVLSRTSSLAALLATPLTLPLFAWYLPPALPMAGVLCGLVLWRHRRNLRDLFSGQERHF